MQNEFAKCTFFKISITVKNIRELLMRTFVLSSDGRLFYPCVIYYYRSVKESLKLLNCKRKFWKWMWEVVLLGWCESYYEWCISCSYVENFCHKLKMVFRTNKNIAAWMYNVECNWFQLYKHLASYSVGTISLIILNLPR